MMPTPELAQGWLESAGLTDVQFEHEEFRLLFRSSREFFFAPVIEYGPLAQWKEIAGRGEEMQEIFWRIKEAIDAYFGTGSFAVTVRAACVQGRKPLEEERRALAEARGEPLVPPPAMDAPQSDGPTAEVQLVTGELQLGTGEYELLEESEKLLLRNDSGEPIVPGDEDDVDALLTPTGRLPGGAKGVRR
jgi:hypothetical protein